LEDVQAQQYAVRLCGDSVVSWGRGEASLKNVQKNRKRTWCSLWVCMFTYDHTYLTALFMHVWKSQCTRQRCTSRLSVVF